MIVMHIPYVQLKVTNFLGEHLVLYPNFSRLLEELERLRDLTTKVRQVK